MDKEKNFYENFLNSKNKSKEVDIFNVTDSLNVEKKQHFQNKIGKSPLSAFVTQEKSLLKKNSAEIKIMKSNSKIKFIQIQTNSNQENSTIKNIEQHPILESTKMVIARFLSNLREKTHLRKIPDNFYRNLEIIKDQSFFLKQNKFLQKTALHLKKIRLIMFLKRIIRYALKNNSLIVHPYNNFKIFWDVVQFLVMIFFFFYLPLDIIFVLDSSGLVRNILSIFMLIDNLLGFRTALFHHGKLITDSKIIFKSYILSFILDNITQMSLVYDIFFFQDDHDIKKKLIKLIFLIQYRKFIHIYQTIVDKFKIDMKFGFLLDFINLLFTSICVLHWVACGWYAIAIYSGETTTWLNLPIVAQRNLVDKYICAFYWSTVTMMTVGYGDIIPQNPTETVFASMVVVIGCGLFAYYIKY